MNTNEIQNLIKDLVEKASLTVNNISLVENNPKNVWFSLEVNDPHFFLSRDGEGLMALNHLVRKIVEPKLLDEEMEILVDVGDFQKKHIENVKAIAHMMAERARYFKSNIEVDPMSAFERRIIHEFLSTATDLKTESEGVGPSRRVVIKYIGSI